MNEFEIIKKYFSDLTGDPVKPTYLRNDGAVLSMPPGKQLAVTTDIITAGVHFFHNDTPKLIAKKALRVNLSDLAAMGAKPIGYSLALQLPSHINEDWIAEFCEGLREDQDLYNIKLLCGDTERSPTDLSIGVTALGSVKEGRCMPRDGAVLGDRIYVTGVIGDAALGLLYLKGELKNIDPVDAEKLVGKYHLPKPRIKVGSAISELAHACIDLSDGFLADLRHVCEGGKLTANINVMDIPLSKVAKRVIKNNPEINLIDTVMAGGDDYELLFTIAPGDAHHVEYLAQRHKVPITHVGHCGSKTPDQEIRLVSANGKEFFVENFGYVHKWGVEQK